MLLTKFALRNESSLAAPYEGWSVNILPVRSTVVVLPQIFARDHAFNPATVAAVCAADSVAVAGFFA